jgi:hypothetical protein
MCFIMSIMAFKYLLKNPIYIPIIRCQEWGSWHMSHYYLNGIFKFVASFKDWGIETCHMEMLNNL